jgi:sialate O-acetylesterase
MSLLSVWGDVRLNGLFTDNMVLQRGRPIPVWGWADSGEKVTVEFRGSKRSVVAKEGKWMVRLPVQRAGGPDVLIVRGKNSLQLNNVMVGEVWIASGQSNMEWPLQRTVNATNAIEQARNPKIRLYTVPKLKSEAPVDDVKAAWQECQPETVPTFSAVGYHFAADLQKALGVPVGIIHTSWGGSPAEVWMRNAELASNARYKREILDTFPPAQQKYIDDLAKWEKETADLKAQGKQQTRTRPRGPWRPSELYNGMIAPLIPYAIRGAIWYQGESNAGRAHQYRTLFPDMIRNWRKDWGQGDFTFLAVQLAPFMKIQPEPKDSTWAELREAQLIATRVLPKVGQAVITDVGNETDIHPQNKQPVGARLALAARHIAYGEDIVWSGPLFHDMKVRNGKAILSFTQTGGGLVERAGKLTGFAIAGADRKFVWADARIKGKRVIVTNPQVLQPVAVRFGWADYPVVNLWNVDGLPATPFRTDDFPMITAPKR